MAVKANYVKTEAGIIPNNWDVTLLDNVARRGTGHTPDKSHPEYWGGRVKWISLQDSDRLDRLYIYDTAVKITQEGIANSSATVHQEGTVVLSRDASVGKSAIMKESMAVSQHFVAWKCGPLLDNHFLYYWLQSNKPEFERIAMGNTIKTIGLPYFEKLIIPLPTKAEQEAIAEALSDADALIESLEQLLAKKRHVKQGAMQELLTGKRRLPGYNGKWDVGRFDELFVVLRNASNSRSELNADGEVAYVHYGDIHTHREVFLDPATKRTFISRGKVRTIPRLANGDLLMVDASEDTTAIGKAVEIVGLNGREAVAGLHTMLLRGKKRLLADGFKGYLQFLPKVRAALVRLATGVSVYGITKSGVKAIEVAIPKPDEQAAIAATLSDLDAEIAAFETKLAKARQIKQGMMQELLTGRIRLV